MRSQISSWNLRLPCSWVLIMLTLVSSPTQNFVSAKDSCGGCRNNGVCMKGKDHAIGGAVNPEQISTSYCSCPKGYTGTVCEIQYVLCPAGKDGICNNGDKCKRAVTDVGEEYYHCECDAMQSDLSTPYARRFCEHASTVFCGITDEKEKNQYRQSLGNAGSSFCANGGKCKEPNKQVKGKHHAGCNCPDGWQGPYCTEPDGNNPLALAPQNPDPLFVHDDEKIAQKQQQQKKPTTKPRSYISYFFSFVISFLLIFTSISLAAWAYLSFQQNSSIGNNVLAVFGGGGAHSRRRALDRARIPRMKKDLPVSEIEIT